MSEYVYEYDPAPEPLLKEGVTDLWQVVWSGEPGPAKVRRVAALVDDEGVVTIEPTGEWQDSTVYDDRA